MRRVTGTIIALVIIVLLVIGGFALFHKSNKSNSQSQSSSSQHSNQAPAVNNAVLITKTNSNVGQYLADPSGKTLYTFGGDSSGVSNCTGTCLANWPAYQATGSTTNLPAGVGTIKRTDNGQTQYTYNGMPLYYFASDGAGQVTGNGVENFQVAKPATSTNSGSNTTNSNSSNNSNYPY